MKTTIKPTRKINTISLDLESNNPKKEKIPTWVIVKVLPKPNTQGKEVNIFGEYNHPDFGKIYTLSIMVMCDETRLKDDTDQKVKLVAFDDNGYVPLEEENYGTLKVNKEQLLNIQNELKNQYDTVVAVPRQSQYVKVWINNNGVKSIQLSMYNHSDITFVV